MFKFSQRFCFVNHRRKRKWATSNVAANLLFMTVGIVGTIVNCSTTIHSNGTIAVELLSNITESTTAAAAATAGPSKDVVSLHNRTKITRIDKNELLGDCCCCSLTKNSFPTGSNCIVLQNCSSQSCNTASKSYNITTDLLSFKNHSNICTHHKSRNISNKLSQSTLITATSNLESSLSTTFWSGNVSGNVTNNDNDRDDAINQTLKLNTGRDYISSELNSISNLTFNKIHPSSRRLLYDDMFGGGSIHLKNESNNHTGIRSNSIDNSSIAIIAIPQQTNNKSADKANSISVVKDFLNNHTSSVGSFRQKTPKNRRNVNDFSIVNQKTPQLKSIAEKRNITTNLTLLDSVYSLRSGNSTTNLSSPASESNSTHGNITKIPITFNDKTVTSQSKNAQFGLKHENVNNSNVNYTQLSVAYNHSDIPSVSHQFLDRLSINTSEYYSTNTSQVSDIVDSTNYYRFGARESDATSLLSRYPSLKIPPPPPEFADEFHEGNHKKQPKKTFSLFFYLFFFFLSFFISHHWRIGILCVFFTRSHSASFPSFSFILFILTLSPKHCCVVSLFFVSASDSFLGPFTLKFSLHRIFFEDLLQNSHNSSYYPHDLCCLAFINFFFSLSFSFRIFHSFSGSNQIVQLFLHPSFSTFFIFFSLFPSLSFFLPPSSLALPFI